MSEYWIREDGDVDFADGDVGEMNHEGIVIQDVQRTIIDACERAFGRLKNKYGRSFADTEYIDWDEFKKALVQAYAQARYPRKINDPMKFLPNALRECGIKKREWNIAEGTEDARDYAMEKFGWKTYRNGHVDTWRITRNDLKAIIAGIENIADESGWSDRKLQRMSFTINVFSNQRHFNLTIEQMKKWLQRPSEPPPPNNPQFDYLSNQANKQVRDIELQNLHPYYRNRTFPFGDSTYSFRAFVERREKMGNQE